jgi:hypothetical protein
MAHFELRDSTASLEVTGIWPGALRHITTRLEGTLMRSAVRHALMPVVLACSVALLAGCSSSVSITGTWTASDGSQTKIINADGSCSGMYYNGKAPLDIGGPETCTLSSAAANGFYSLVVRQSPNQASYQVKFDGDKMTMSLGGQDSVTLTRQ